MSNVSLEFLPPCTVLTRPISSYFICASKLTNTTFVGVRFGPSFYESLADLWYTNSSIPPWLSMDEPKQSEMKEGLPRRSRMRPSFCTTRELTLNGNVINRQQTRRLDASLPNEQRKNDGYKGRSQTLTKKFSPKQRWKSEFNFFYFHTDFYNHLFLELWNNTDLPYLCSRSSPSSYRNKCLFRIFHSIIYENSGADIPYPS